MTANDKSPRRKAREIALQILFQREFAPELSVTDSLRYFREHISATDEAWAYGEALLSGVIEFRDVIDTAIRESSKNWKIERMSPVDLALLRIAVFEMRHGTPVIPYKAAIDEAIELGKKYGSTESGGFINGILDDIHHKTKDS